MSTRQANIGKSISSNITSQRYPQSPSRRVVRVQFTGVVNGKSEKLNTYIFPVLEPKGDKSIFRGYAVAELPANREKGFEEFLKGEKKQSAHFRTGPLVDVIKAVRAKIRTTDISGLFWENTKAPKKESKDQPGIAAKKGTFSPLMCPPRTADGTLRIDKKGIDLLSECLDRQPQTKDIWTKNGQYVPERRALHTKIVLDFLRQKPCIVKNKPVAILTGGPPGSGKSTFIRKFAPWMLSGKMFVIDADDVRSKLPEYEGWNANSTHKETKDIVNRMLDSVGSPCRTDLLYDGTMNSAASYIPLLRKIKSMGYEVYVIYMQVPKKVSKGRVLSRYRETGRYVPLSVVDDIFDKGMAAFDEVTKMADGFIRVDGMTGTILEKGGKEIPTERRYEDIACGEVVVPTEGTMAYMEATKSGNCDDQKKLDPEPKKMVEVKPEATPITQGKKRQGDALGRSIEIKLPNGEKRKGAFAVVEADSIIASHDHDTFLSSPGYPTDAQGDNINDRNYKDDKNLQSAVIKYARELDPERVITTSRTESGTPIIDKNGFVVSGNNRTMSIKRAMVQHPERYRAYKEFLADEIDSFGIEREVIDKFKKPILVRFDYDIPALNTLELSKYNKDTKKGESPVDKAIKLSKQLDVSPGCKTNLSTIVGEYETLSEFYSSGSDQRRVLAVLQQCDIITEQEKPTYFDDGFTAGGKELMENVLAGLVMNKQSLLVLNNQAKSTRQIIITSLPVLSANATKGADSLIADLNDAIIVEGKIRASGLPFDKWITQLSMFDETPSKRALELNRLLAAGRNKFKGAIEKYNNGIDASKADMFGDAPSADDVYKAYIVAAIPQKEEELIEQATGEGQLPEPAQAVVEKKKGDDDVTAETETKDPEPGPTPELSSTVQKIARTAWYGTSFSPEKRAKTFVKEYSDQLASDVRTLERIPEDERRISVEDYIERYNQKLAAYVGAKSRTMSSMVTGPANFPTRRNQNALQSERNRYNEFAEWREKMLTPLKKRFNPSDADKDLQKQRIKVANLEKGQQFMKEVNAAYRQYKKNPESINSPKISDNIRDAVVNFNPKDRYSWEQKPFPSYSLTNNNATLKAAKARLEEMERKVKMAEGPVKSKVQISGTYNDNPIEFDLFINTQIDRIQLLFDGKPEADVRNLLKSNGFKWSPSQKAWQRTNNNPSIAAVGRILRQIEFFPPNYYGSQIGRQLLTEEAKKVTEYLYG